MLPQNQNDAAQDKWLAYTRHPLMDAYRDNLYKERYQLVVSISLKEQYGTSIAGVLLRVSDASGLDERVTDIEEFLFAVMRGDEQKVGAVTARFAIEDFTAPDAKILRFLDSFFRDGAPLRESGRLWLKNTAVAGLVPLIRDHRRVVMDGKPLVVSDIVLAPRIKGDMRDGALALSVELSGDSGPEHIVLAAEEVRTFGPDCPYILNGHIFHLTKPSFPELKKSYFSSPCVVPAEYFADFQARVVPTLKRDFSLALPDMNADTVRESFPVQPLVFLNYDGKTVSATIKYKYGKCIIEPYAKGAETEPEKLIYRDREKEAFFASTLARYLDKSGEYMFTTDDDERIFNLTYRMLPELQEKGWTFYYGEAFRKLRFNVKPPRMNVSITKDIDFFEVAFSIDGITDLPDIATLVKSVKEGKEYIRLQNGSFVPIDKEVIGYIAKMMTDTPMQREDKNSYLLPLFSAPYFVEEMEKSTGVTMDIAPSAHETLKVIKNPVYDETGPEHIVGSLRPYQEDGYRWLRKLAAMKLSGVLADDMGLGKSFQTIASLVKEKETGATAPSLIVCPTSCVLNWHLEFSKFAPQMTVTVIQGDTDTRERRIHALVHHDIGITSYAALRRDVKRYNGVALNYIILDEAQHIKNANTQNAKAAKALASAKRLVLTGTPMENGIGELWSIFDFLMPGFFPRHREFADRYEAPILAGDEVALTGLKRRIAPFILRRLKKDVLKDLPPKMTNVSYCDLTNDQKELYLSILDAARIEIFDAVKKKGFKNARIEIFSALTRLRQVCCHPLLLDVSKRGASNTSGKYRMFMELIDEVLDGGHNVIVFSQFTKMLAIIREAFKRRGIGHLYLDGATKDRMDLVNRFNAGEAPVFLLSLKAAGTGLTLTKADTVIHFDPWWNPMVEDQATDRAYRIGQTRAVTNYKLVTKGTIEEKIIMLQEKKRTLVDSIIGEGGMGGKLNWDDIKEIIR